MLTHKVSSTDLKVRTTFIDSRFDSGSVRVTVYELLNNYILGLFSSHDQIGYQVILKIDSE